MRCRRLTLLAAAAMALALPAPASAVVHGDAVEEYADYPAQVFVGRDTNGNGSVDEYCSGTLIGSRQILTAARCATYGVGLKLPDVGFKIRIGDVDLTAAQQYTVAAGGNDRHTLYNPDTGIYDVAILTLTEPVELPDFAPVRVVEANEEPTLWPVGTPARVLGWGEMENTFLSEVLLQGDVARLPDADCDGAPSFDARYMLCAAGAEQNPCAGDSGSPLLVPEGGFFALAGVFSGASCATPGAPGVFTRVGAEPLNAWVHARTPEANFDFVNRRQPQAGVPFDLVSTSRHPEDPGYFTQFHWDLDNDGDFDDRSGPRITLNLAAGQAVVGLQSSRLDGDTASIYYAFDVLPGSSNAPPGSGDATITTPPAPPAIAKPAAPLAAIASAKRPKVGRRGRFAIRVRFARTAPRGIAVIEVFRGKRKIGIARTRVLRGGEKRVKVKLTPTGRRRLKGSSTKRLKVRVRVRVGSQILRSKTLTIRR
jgi:hypothetical protein